MGKKSIGIILSAVLLLCSVIFTVFFIKVGYAETAGTALDKLIKDVTAGYKMKQIIATMIMFLSGLVISVPLCKNLGAGYAVLLSVPVANAVWGVVSELLLFLNIPYSPYVMAPVMLAGLIMIAARYRNDYKWVVSNWHLLVMAFLAALSLAIMASSGVFAIFTSSDSYYYVMQYGELIVNNAGLSSDIVGNFMTWTGISSALTSAYAAMWGFENIYAIHYLLIFSMYGFIALLIYQKAVTFCTPGISYLCAGLSLLTVAMVPPTSELSMWIISNAYFMVYLVFLMMLPVIAEGITDMRIICIMALFTGWLSLCRIEAAPLMCFLIICISSLHNISKRQTLTLLFSAFILEALYLLKVLYEYCIGAKQASQQELTLSTAAIILLAFVLTGAYLFLYDLKFVVFIRKHISVFGIMGLMGVCLGLGILDWERFKNNVGVVATNMGDWYWKYIPIMVLVCEIIKTCLKCRNQYFDLAVWGFILFNFAICMGRTDYLRLGVGDSYNRICMSIVPLYICSTIYTFLACIGKGMIRDNAYSGGLISKRKNRKH